MRSIFAVVSLVLTLAFSVGAPIKSAFAVSSAGVAVQKKFASGNVGTSTWVPVVTSTVKGVKAIAVYNSAPSPLEVGIASASAAADAEVRQMIIPGLQTSTSPVPVVMPLTLGYGTRVSIRALGSTAATGEMDMSLFYN